MTGWRGREGGRDERLSNESADSRVGSDKGESQGQAPLESRSVIICDGDGETLTEATIRLDGGLRLIVLADVAEAHALMDYYFGRSGSDVFVVCDGSSAEGRLETRWHGIGRTWMVRMRSPLTSSLLGTASGREQTPTDVSIAAGSARSG